MTQRYCLNCIYFYKSLEQCRRFPPVPIREDFLRIETYYPRVSDYNWCGEWKKKNEK